MSIDLAARGLAGSAIARATSANSAALAILGPNITPYQIPGLQLWLRADVGAYSDAGSTLCTNAATVQQWNDQSGYGRNATQGTSGQRPAWNTNIVNGLPAITWTSGNRLLAGTNSALANQTFTVFAVFKPTGTPANGCVLSKGDGLTATGSSWDLNAHSTASTTFDTFHGSVNNNVSGGTYNVNQWQLVTAQRVSNTNKNLWRNGLMFSTGNGDGAAMNAGQFPLGIGNSGSTGALAFTGSIAEVLYYAGALSTLQRQAIEQYLIAKYNLNAANFACTMSTFNYAPGTGAAEPLQVFNSPDGFNFSAPAGITNPVFAWPGAGGAGASTGTGASSIMFYNSLYWVAYEYNNSSGSNNKFGIASAPSLGGPWKWVVDVTAVATTTPTTNVWNPRFFGDDDDSIHIIVNVESGVTYDTAFHPVILDAANAGLTTWSAPTSVTGTFPANMIDVFMLTPGQSPNGLYNIWYKDEATNYVGYMSSSSRASGYTVTQSGNWMGIGTAEGPMLVSSNGVWRFYWAPLSHTQIQYVDSFDNWSTWSAFTNLNFNQIKMPIIGHTGSILFNVPR